MSNVLGLWHLILKGGQETIFRTPSVVQVTNVSFGEEIADEKSRSVLKLTFMGLVPDVDDDEEGLIESTTVMCALTPGKLEHATLNIALISDEDYKFQNTGKNTIYLTGHYIDSALADDSEDDEDDEGEDAYDLREVSSDVEMHVDDLDVLESDGGRFEEVEEESPKPMKRSRQSEGTGAESKPEKKKKLKADDGKPVLVEAPAAEEKSPEKEKEKKKKKKDKKEKTEDAPKTDKKDDNAKKTIAGGVTIQDFKVGKGPVAKKGDTVRMRYIGKLVNGKQFDKNTSGHPFTFHLGKNEVIKGWDEGIVGMQAGGERVLTIPPAMAYGKEEKPGIPRNSTLIFEVKLLDIKS